MRLFFLLSLLLTGFLSFSQSFIADTAINKIALEDSVSVLNILGKDSWNALTEDSESVKTNVYNKDKTQRLELIFHEGDNRNCFSEFRVLQNLKNNSGNDHKYLLLKEDHFVSSKGISLGLNPKAIEEKLGFKLEQKQGKKGELILFFQKDVAKDPAFKKYNMPVYYGQYIFQNDKLIEFSFGFEQL